MILYLCRPHHRPNFKINCDDEELLNFLRLQHGFFIGETPVSDTYDISIINRGNDFIINHNGTDIYTRIPLYEIDNIFFETTEYDDSILALHGGAVGWQGKAYIFLAATTSGKTTLISYLTNSKFGYITDDCILIGRDRFLVHPYNCPVQLRSGGLEVLTKLNKVPSNLEYIDDEIMQRYIYTPQNRVIKPLPLNGIYFIERSETENVLIPLSTNEKMTELMKSPITQYKTSPEYLRLLGKLTKFRCYKLLYSEMNFVVETIRKANDNIG